MVVAVVDAVLGTALGLLASGFASTEFQAVQFMPAFVLPQFLLCGLLVVARPAARRAQAISDVLPLSYAVDAMNAVAADPEPLADDRARPRGDPRCGSRPPSLLGSLTLRRRTP